MIRLCMQVLDMFDEKLALERKTDYWYKQDVLCPGVAAGLNKYYVEYKFKDQTQIKL